MTSVRLPDFILAGAPRSGTTWLVEALDRHPDIWFAKPLRPEPKFFLIDELYAEGIEVYARRWFSDAPDGGAVGEKSTNYLESAVAAERMAKHLPDARLIFVLREPVARALSNYRWSVMNGLETEDFATAVKLEDEREASVRPELRYARPHAYFSRGLYADLLTPYYERFGHDQILCLRFEDLVTAAAETTASVHSFLGVARRPALAEGLGTINASVADVVVDPRTIDELRNAYREPNQRLAELLGGSFQIWDRNGSTT